MLREVLRADHTTCRESGSDGSLLLQDCGLLGDRAIPMCFPATNLKIILIFGLCCRILCHNAQCNTELATLMGVFF